MCEYAHGVASATAAMEMAAAMGLMPGVPDWGLDQQIGTEGGGSEIGFSLILEVKRMNVYFNMISIPDVAWDPIVACVAVHQSFEGWHCAPVMPTIGVSNMLPKKEYHAQNRVNMTKQVTEIGINSIMGSCLRPKSDAG
ncbi:hypothetical protein ACJX0J_023398 [Zea mays]